MDTIFFPSSRLKNFSQTHELNSNFAPSLVVPSENRFRFCFNVRIHIIRDDDIFPLLLAIHRSVSSPVPGVQEKPRCFSLTVLCRQNLVEITRKETAEKKVEDKIEQRCLKAPKCVVSIRFYQLVQSPLRPGHSCLRSSGAASDEGMLEMLHVYPVWYRRKQY